MSCRSIFCCAWLAAGGLLLTAGEAAAAPLDFARQIRPILADIDASAGGGVGSGIAVRTRVNAG